MKSMSYLIAALTACGLCAGMSTAAHAQDDDHRAQCLAIAVELDDRADTYEKNGEAADFVDNLRTSAAAIAKLWDDGETTPSQEDMENVHDAAIDDLLDAAGECIDNAG